MLFPPPKGGRLQRHRKSSCSTQSLNGGVHPAKNLPFIELYHTLPTHKHFPAGNRPGDIRRRQGKGPGPPPRQPLLRNLSGQQ